MENLLLKTLLEMISFFEDNNLDYVLAGGLAFSILTEPRSTMDIDICCYINENQFEHIRNLLKNYFKDIYIHQKYMRFGKIKIWRLIVFTIKEIIVDLIIIDEKHFLSVNKNKQKIKINNKDIYIISKEDLIILKMISGRPQDKIDIEKIENKYADTINKNYIQEWLKIYN